MWVGLTVHKLLVVGAHVVVPVDGIARVGGADCTCWCANSSPPADGKCGWS